MRLRPTQCSIIVDREATIKRNRPPDPIDEEPDPKYVRWVLLQDEKPIDKFRIILDNGGDC